MAVASAGKGWGSGATGGGRRRSVPAGPMALWVCLAGWTSLALYLFFTPDPDRLTSQIDPSFGHFAVFTAIAVTAAALVPRERSYVPVVALGLAAGLAVEVAQELLVTARGFQATDVVADGAGLLLGTAAVGFVRRLVPWRDAVTGAIAMASAAGLLAASVVAGIGTDRLRHHLECWGRSARPGEALLEIDRATIRVAGDPEAEAELATQLGPLRVRDGYEFDGRASAGIDEATTVTCALRSTGAFTVVAELEDVPLDQEGPARIFTISEGWAQDEIDLHVGVSGDALSVRLRTSPHALHVVEIPGVVGRGRLRLEVSFDGDVLAVRVDSALVYRTTLPVDPYAWRRLPLTIGDEHGGERPLRGRLTRLQVYAP